MNILYCFAFILISIFEFVVCKCIKDIYDRLDLLADSIEDIYDKLNLLERYYYLSGDSDE